MASRVVHARISDRLIALSCLLLSNYGKDPKNLPVSRIITTALEGLIEGAVRQGLLDDLSESEVQETLVEYTSAPLDIGVLEPYFGGEEEEESGSEADLMEEIDRAVKRTMDSGIEGDAPEELPLLDELKKPQNIKKVPLETLKTVAPKDLLIESIKEEDPREVEALETLYGVLPRDLWGTKRAVDMFMTMLGREQGAGGA